MLQNHPGLHRYPTGLLDMQRYLHHGPPARKLAWMALFAIDMMIIAMLGVVLFLDKTPARNGSAMAMVALAALAAVVLTGVLAVMAFWFFDTLRREQRRYHRLAATPVLSERQRQALRLDLVSTYQTGQWSETLEYWPLRARVPADLTFELLPIEDAKPYQLELFNRWNISRSADYLDTLRHLRQGMHSPSIAAALSSTQPAASRDAVSRHLACLTELPLQRVLACVETQPDGRAPSLAWGFDLWRAVWLTRTAYMAGYISAEHAWIDLLTTADQVHEIFASHDDFADSYRLGIAFWGNDDNLCKERHAAQQNCNTRCDWPMAQLAWPPRPGLPLSENIRNGFQQRIRRLQLVPQSKAEAAAYLQTEKA